MDISEVPYLPAVRQGDLIKAKEISPVELTEAYLERIHRLDSKLHSYITIAGEDALDQARMLEQEIVKGDSKGPLYGVPVAIKDQCHVRGWRTTGGSRLFKDCVADEDCSVVAKLRQAGVILLGKLNMTELALVSVSEDTLYGTARNPWNLGRSPGSSSSGPGAATAAFLCAAAIGEDTGGSIRNPAAYCGIVGLRPTWGRVSRHGMLSGCWSMDTLGPMARTVEDCAVLFEAIAGHDPKDQYTWKEPVPDYRDALIGNIRGLKIGLIKESLDPSIVDQEVIDKILLAAAKLESLGAVVEETSIPTMAQAAIITMTISFSEAASVYSKILRTRPRSVGHAVQVRLLAAKLLPAEVYIKAVKLRQLVRQEVMIALERFHALISPSAATEAQLLDFSPSLHSKQEVLHRLISRSRITAPFNLASVPAISVPCGFTSNDLPVGLQITGNPLDEWTILKIAHAYEQATPWRERRPLVC